MVDMNIGAVLLFKFQKEVVPRNHGMEILHRCVLGKGKEEISRSTCCVYYALKTLLMRIQRCKCMARSLTQNNKLKRVRLQVSLLATHKACLFYHFVTGYGKWVSCDNIQLNPYSSELRIQQKTDIHTKEVLLYCIVDGILEDLTIASFWNLKEPPILLGAGRRWSGFRKNWLKTAPAR